jgi:hypothetical protein
MQPAGQAGDPIAPTRTAPKVGFASHHCGLAQRPSGSQVQLKPLHKPLIVGSARLPTAGPYTVPTRLFSMNRYETATKQVCRMGL